MTYPEMEPINRVTCQMIEDRYIPKMVIARYYEWLISNASDEDYNLGVFRPYFWSFSLLCTAF